MCCGGVFLFLLEEVVGEVFVDVVLLADGAAARCGLG